MSVGVLVLVMVGEAVGVGERVFVGVPVIVGVLVIVGELVIVSVSVFVEELVGVELDVPVAVEVGVKVDVEVQGVLLAFTQTVEVGLKVAVGSGEDEVTLLAQLVAKSTPTPKRRRANRRGFIRASQISEKAK